MPSAPLVAEGDGRRDHVRARRQSRRAATAVTTGHSSINVVGDDTRPLVRKREVACLDAERSAIRCL